MDDVLQKSETHNEERFLRNEPYLRFKVGSDKVQRDERVARKGQLAVSLDKVHLDLLEDFMPFLGNKKAEVARNIIIDWLRNTLGWEKLKEKKAIK